MDEYIILADGMEIQGAHILPLNADSIIVYVKGGATMAQMFSWFGDFNRTRSIRAYQYGEESERNGYTELYALRLENDGLATACLRK